MNVEQAYNSWADQYDTNQNRTRDLEAAALREILTSISFQHCLEIGCGTGKNTVWLQQKAERITAVDLSEEMLAKARQKADHSKVNFVQADISRSWNFGHAAFDLVSFSLVLEHIQNLDPIFSEAAKALRPGGYVYVGELHPFKQYSGSKARFETGEGVQVVDCFNHHVSDFVQSAEKAGMQLSRLNEYFDEGDRSGLPRILAMIFKKK